MFNPIWFNYLIMTMYILNAIGWAWQGKWADFSYWMCAFGITATVTFGYRHLRRYNEAWN